MRSRGAIAAALFIALCTSSAQGQVPPEVAATRNGLIDEAYAAAQAGDHTRALDLALRAGALSWTASLHGFVAEQQNALGQLAAALGSAQLCIQGAERDLAMPRREEFLSGCRTLAESLAPRVAHVTVRRPQPAPAGLHVSIDGTDVADNLLDVPYVVTPGSLHVAAAAPGFYPWSFSTETQAGQSLTVDVVLRPEPHVDVLKGGPGTDASSRSSGPVLRTLGWIGIAAAGAFALEGVITNIVERNALDHAIHDGCYQSADGTTLGPASCADDVSTVTALTNASIVGYVGAGVLGVAGAVLLLVAPSSGPRIVPATAGTGIAVVGSF